MYQVIDTHIEDGLSRLMQQYRALPQFGALLTAIIERVQALEGAIEAVLLSRPLSEASAAQLDRLGELIGLARNGLDDATYLALLRGIIALNNSDASANSLENVLRIIFQAPQIWIQTPNTPGHARRLTPAQLSLAVVDPESPSSLYPLLTKLVKQGIAGGVALTQVDRYTAQGTKTFAFAGSQPWVAGFGAGVFATPIYQNPLD